MVPPSPGPQASFTSPTGPPSGPVPPHGRGAGGANSRGLPLIGGVAVGCLASSVVLLALATSTGQLDLRSFLPAYFEAPPLSQLGGTPAITFPPQWTTTPTPHNTPTGTATTIPSPTVVLSYEQRFPRNQGKIERAMSYMEQEDFAQAVVLWDEILSDLPEFADGYYQRAKTYLGLLRNQRFEAEYVAYLNLGFQDVDQAIALSPSSPGNYFLARHDYYDRWAGISEYRVDMEWNWNLALDNIRMAAALGSSDPFAERTVALLLAILGRCEDSLTHSRALLAAQPVQATPSAGINTALAAGYRCRGDLNRALQHIETAIEIRPEPGRFMARAIILYNLGRRGEALDQMDELIEADPYYSGFRYYFRALIRYELGNTEGARDDLAFGSGQTWGRSGLYAYVNGRLLIDAGDREAGIEALQYGEATLDRSYGPLVDRMRTEIEDLDAEPLHPAPSSTADPTPMPSPIPSVTPRPAGAGTAPTPEGARAIDMATGTGPLTLAADAYPVYRFQTNGVQFSSVVSLSVFLIKEGTAAQPTLQIYPWNSSEGGWGLVEASWGENSIDFPGRYVTKQGDVYLGIRNWGEIAISLQNVAVRLVVATSQGTHVVYGYGAD